MDRFTGFTPAAIHPFDFVPHMSIVILPASCDGELLDDETRNPKPET